MLIDIRTNGLWVNGTPIFRNQPAHLQRAIQMILATSELGRKLHNNGHPIFPDDLAKAVFPQTGRSVRVEALQEEILAVDQAISAFVTEQGSIFTLNFGRYTLSDEVELKADCLLFEAAFEVALLDKNYNRISFWKQVINQFPGTFMDQLNDRFLSDFSLDYRDKLDRMLDQAKVRVELLMPAILRGRTEDELATEYLESIEQAKARKKHLLAEWHRQPFDFELQD